MTIFEITQYEKHIRDLVKKLLCIYTMEYYTAIKRKWERFLWTDVERYSGYIKLKKVCEKECICNASYSARKSK